MLFRVRTGLHDEVRQRGIVTSQQEQEFDDAGYQGCPEEALILFEQAINASPESETAWNGKGNALKDLRRFEEALHAYERALALDPHYANAWNGRGVALWFLYRYKEALTAYEQSLKLHPDNAQALRNKALVLHKLGRIAEAEHTMALFKQASKPSMTHGITDYGFDPIKS